MNNDNIIRILRNLNLGPADLNNLNSLSKEELIELSQVLERLEEDSFLDYVPQDYQKAWHMSGAKTKLIIGGNRSGKTIGAFHDVMWQLTGEYPDWYPEDMKLELPVFTRWIAPDFKNGIGGVFQPYFDKLLPRRYIKRIVKTQQGIITKVFFENGSVLDLLTNEQDLDVFEGWSGHRLHVDEPCTRSRFIASKRGLIDYGGKCSFSLTPLSEPWIFDELYSQADGKHIFQITVDTTKNKYLKKEEIDEFVSSLTEDEKEVRLHGKFKHLSGLIYKSFDPDVHIIKDFHISSDWRRIQLLDPHDRKPHAIGWMAVDPYDNLYIYDELEVTGTVKQVVRAVRAKEAKHRIHLRIIDPNKGKSPSQLGKKGTLVDEFKKEGLYYYDQVNDNLAEGHLMVQRYLEYDKSKPLNLSNTNGNKPKLFVFRSCKKFIYGFQHYMWDDFRESDIKDPKEKPKDKDKDFPDLVRYCCMTKPTFSNPAIFTKERKRTGRAGY